MTLPPRKTNWSTAYWSFSLRILGWTMIRRSISVSMVSEEKLILLTSYVFFSSVTNSQGGVLWNWFGMLYPPGDSPNTGKPLIMPIFFFLGVWTLVIILVTSYSRCFSLAGSKYFIVSSWSAAIATSPKYMVSPVERLISLIPYFWAHSSSSESITGL